MLSFRFHIIVSALYMLICSPNTENTSNRILIIASRLCRSQEWIAISTAYPVHRHCIFHFEGPLTVVACLWLHLGFDTKLLSAEVPVAYNGISTHEEHS